MRSPAETTKSSTEPGIGPRATGGWAGGSGRAGGALAAPRIALVPGMDATIINECFIIVIIGGLGNLWGSFLGALAFGLVVQFGTVLAPNWQDVLPYLLMLVVLIIRPWGLLGRPEVEKV